MAHESPIRRHLSLADPAIPDKLYFRIGEVARLCEVPAYVLRFWESEFPQLKPNKGGTGQRLFRRRDVEMALRIKCLLYDEGYTIPGARQLLKGEQKQKEEQLPLTAEMTPAAQTEQLQHLRKELRDLLAIVSRGDAARKLESPRQGRAPAPAEERMEQLLDFEAAHGKGGNG